MKKSEREELKRLAEAATPGKWSTDICQIDKSWLKGRLQNCVVNPSGVVAIVSESDPDAAFIAAANPAAIQSLLAYVDRLEAQRDRLLDAMRRIFGTLPAQQDGGGFVVDHRDSDGEYIGSQNIDPMWVVQEMVSVAHKAITEAESQS